MDYSCGKVDGLDPVAIDEAYGEMDVGRRLVSGTFYVDCTRVREIPVNC